MFDYPSGKSTVGKLLLDTTTNTEVDKPAVFRIIDTDKIGHQILLSPARLARQNDDQGDRYVVASDDSVFQRVVATFGDKSVDNKNILTDEGEIDRRKLGDIIFQDVDKRKALNRITHPCIIRVMLQQLMVGSLFSRGSVVCADVPLLFESGSMRWLFGLIIVVACDPDLQYRRLCQRNPDLTEKQCRDRIATQIPIDRKASLADIAIWNDGTLDALSAKVSRVKLDLQHRLGGRDLIYQYLCIAGGAMLLLSAFPAV
jgi:dephospho-CoA kinase